MFCNKIIVFKLCYNNFIFLKNILFFSTHLMFNIFLDHYCELIFSCHSKIIPVDALNKCIEHIKRLGTTNVGYATRLAIDFRRLLLLSNIFFLHKLGFL